MDCEFIEEFGFDEETKKNIEKYTIKYEEALTEEEINKLELEDAEKLRQYGFLPKNDEYAETMSSPMIEVESFPKSYIIEECIPACKVLWDKNIYTFMTSDFFDRDKCWIEIKECNLSSHNRRIYDSLEGNDVLKFVKHKGAICFGVRGLGRSAQRKLEEIAEKFVMQDVPYGDAYKNIDDFLVDNCGCYDKIPNPVYKYMAPLNEAQVDLDKLGDYIKEYDKWTKSKESEKMIKSLNTKKLNKSLSEYLEEYGFILEDKKVYLGKYHYDKHLNFIRSI